MTKRRKDTDYLFLSARIRAMERRLLTAQRLEQLLTQYQRGTELLGYCRDRLQAIEDQVKVLDDAGALKPWALE